MFIPQNPVIVVLGVFLSFILFTQGEDYNFRTTVYGEVIRECQDEGLDYDNCFYRRGAKIKEKYGASYTDLKRRKDMQKAYLINPCVILIVTLFVAFAVSKNEILLTFAAFIPAALVFLINAASTEARLGRYYLIFIALIAHFISRAKRFLWVVNP